MSTDQMSRLDHSPADTHLKFKQGRVGDLRQIASFSVLPKSGPILYQMALTGSAHGEQ